MDAYRGYLEMETFSLRTGPSQLKPSIIFGIVSEKSTFCLKSLFS